MSGILAYIGASSHSGSTLLDLMLNNSPRVQSLGEAFRLCWFARTNRQPCTCGKPITECPFWLRIEEEARKELELSDRESLLQTLETALWPDRLGRVTTALQKGLLILGNRPLYLMGARLFTREHHKACKNSLFWYDIIRRTTGCSVIVDSSKNTRRLKALYLTDPKRFRLIHLLRDGRAIAASAMRREHIDIVGAATAWVKGTRSLLWASRSISPKQVHQLRYESLCRDPESAIHRVCQFLEIPFDQDMLTLRKKEAHNIGGNLMRFRYGETTIRLDERWREELSADDLKVFERIGGRWNRRLGYGD